MARLFMDLAITFTGPALSKEGRAELRLIKLEARQAARRAMVRVRKVARSIAPRRTGKLARSMNVKNSRAGGRNGVGVRLETSRRAFYALPTSKGRQASYNVGWWERGLTDALLAETAGELGRNIHALGQRYAALIGRDIIKRFLGRILEGTLRITGASIRSVPLRGGAGRAAAVNFDYGDS